MTWDKNKPTGLTLVSAVDNDIRELKQDLENILGKEHYFPYDNVNLKTYHKFALLTTAQEGNTRNGQVWYNTSLKQLSYKIAGQIKRCARYIPSGFSFLVLAVPTSATDYFSFVSEPSVVDYILGVSNSFEIYSGKKDLTIISAHTAVSNYRFEHSHTFTCSFGDASGQLIGVSRGSGSKVFSEDKKQHHSSANYISSQITLEHNHQLTTTQWSPSFFRGFFIRRR